MKIPKALSLMLLLTPVACGKGTGPVAEAQAAPSSSAAAPRVRFVKLTEKTLPRTLEFSGALEAHERSEVATQTPGVVKLTEVDVGSRVAKGDVLAVLDASDAALRNAAAAANAEQQRARLNLDKGGKLDVDAVPDVKTAQETRDLAKLQRDRSAKLLNDGAISQSDYDIAKSTYQRAESQLTAAKNGAQQAWAGLKAAEAQARLSQKALRDTRILAPFDGAVVERRVSVGEFASVGRVVAVVVNDNPLRLRIDVPESDVARISPGKLVEIRVSAYPDQRFSGTVARIGAALNSASRSLPVEADVPNDDGRLRPGFFARARVDLGGKPEATLFVPKAALGDSGSARRVFVRDGKHVSEKLVTTGRVLGDLIEVRGDLKSGDEVAVERVSELNDGQDVEAVH